MTAAVLVDTHILVWLRTSPEKLTAGERRTLDAAKLRYLSVVAFWEIAILMNLGRIAPEDRLIDIPDGFDLLTVRPEHCRALIGLPRRHRDPFDRMLIAQSVVEQIPLLTRDRAFADYADAGAVVLSFGGG